MEIRNHGQIEWLPLPENWVEVKDIRQVNIGSRSVRQFHPEGAPEAKLHLYYRGFPLSVADGASFANVLAKAAHLLSAAETKTLAALLGQRANPESFLILGLRTEDLNGKRVLVLEGRYKELQQDIYEIFVDGDGTGQAVQEIYLLAHKDVFVRYLRTYKAVLQQIQWKQGAVEIN